jgi:prepilin-type N-terminal cleavage/methylation domain-containing protein
MKTRAKNRGRRQAGFTLLEVLVATMILGTAVAALFGLLSGSLSNARRLQAPEQALLLARSELNALLAASEQGRAASPALPLDQSIRGSWDDNFRWEARASRVPTTRPVNPGAPILVRVEFNTYWKTETGSGEKQLSFETYELWQEPR